ncbi:type II secretion system protein [Candidatus Sumerlaeota bacterium]
MIQPTPRSRPYAGFTKVELALVVGIIIVLTIVSVPVLRQMKIQRNVAQVKQDFKILATALEAYFVDCSEYPAMANGDMGLNGSSPYSGSSRVCTFRRRTSDSLCMLTTPINYILQYPSDPFADASGVTYGYRQYRYWWILISYGPDRDENEVLPGDHYNVIPVADVPGLDLPYKKRPSSPMFDRNFEPVYQPYARLGMPPKASSEYLSAIGVASGNALIYDPSNGLISEGDIVRVKR